jgi:3-oxoacyl-[acyl-carrier protein] reductase
MAVDYRQELTGKVVVVTGAGTGIGKGIALAFGEQGATVVVSYEHSEKGALEAEARLHQANPNSFAIRTDLRDLAQIRTLFETVLRRLGRIDIMVNNSGVTLETSFFDMTVEDWNMLHEINLRGMFFCTQAAARDMMKRRWGRVINLSSVNAHGTFPHYAAYAATKGGINGLTRAMALDLAPLGITVNAIGPGCIEVESYAKLPNYTRESMARQIPMGRVGFPRDIAATALFLASEGAGWLTGQVIYHDGGQTARTSATNAFLDSYASSIQAWADNEAQKGK